ncbi:hypothetical protein AVEN_248413-1 [Araneus ventricosus]|uniref:Uncharacterized protein n=1 Tax=Araneus ventricosus TaxID=182803 RepID=A0A4Y2X404_ARAVE|nr:hypothetical protein AVEN_178235-1 [Araneus ventricosus]GBO20571.1 hypothetical protein AVEN_255044-1 [Araneus ventricosus]GBO44269.1 hypothetical protein AVEN_198765-1 [Araneus ventricosus]GBO44300.1 hypothetical protein AVEN_248413-1 [Araneus ventricosus]
MASIHSEKQIPETFFIPYDFLFQRLSTLNSRNPSRSFGYAYHRLGTSAIQQQVSTKEIIMCVSLFCATNCTRIKVRPPNQNSSSPKGYASLWAYELNASQKQENM